MAPRTSQRALCSSPLIPRTFMAACSLENCWAARCLSSGWQVAQTLTVTIADLVRFAPLITLSDKAGSTTSCFLIFSIIPHSVHFHFKSGVPRLFGHASNLQGRPAELCRSGGGALSLSVSLFLSLSLSISIHAIEPNYFCALNVAHWDFKCLLAWFNNKQASI